MEHGQATQTPQNGFSDIFAGTGEVFGVNVFLKCKVLPILMYCLPVVAPRSQQMFLLLEKVNRFTLQLLCNDFLSPYLDLLRQH